MLQSPNFAKGEDMLTNYIKSSCLFCSAGCGIVIEMQDGKPVKITGDSDCPSNKGVLCVVGKNALEQLYSPDRLQYPLKRVGKRGEGKWQRISWDEALDIISLKFGDIKEKFGAKASLFMRGGTKGYCDSLLLRFANAYGTPNTSMAAPLCFLPTLRAHFTTYGYFSTPDYENTSCVMMWGVNKSATSLPDSLRPTQAMRSGAKLIVIDPAETSFTKKADIWVRLRPGSDLALALALIHVIIYENLYDRNFVDQWIFGFNELKEHVKEYTPEKMSEVTWVSAETIRKVARMYAQSAPACLISGNGIEHGINNFQIARATCILRSLTGNLGRKGGDIDWTEAPVIPAASRELWLNGLLSDEERAQSISAKQKMLPGNPYQLHQDITKAILEGDPYKLRAVYLMGANPIHSFADSQRTYDALSKVEFLVVADQYMTPSTKLADIILPVTTHLEHDRIHVAEFLPTVQIIQKVAQVGECRSNAQIFIDLAQRMGLGEHFWKNEQEFLNHLLEPSGMTFEELRQVAHIPCEKRYNFFEQSGFDTPSRKVELYSSLLEEWGFDPLPIHKEQPESPYSEPELYKEYPLVMTSIKIAPYKHSCGRQISVLRTSHPDPIARLHPETAAQYNITDGNWMYVENKRGRVKFKAKFVTSIDPRIIIVEHGWWFPENESDVDYWSKSNVNMLTYADKPYASEMGSATVRGLICKISSAK